MDRKKKTYCQIVSCENNKGSFEQMFRCVFIFLNERINFKEIIELNSQFLHILELQFMNPKSTRNGYKLSRNINILTAAKRTIMFASNIFKQMI